MHVKGSLTAVRRPSPVTSPHEWEHAAKRSRNFSEEKPKARSSEGIKSVLAVPPRNLRNDDAVRLAEIRPVMPARSLSLSK